MKICIAGTFDIYGGGSITATRLLEALHQEGEQANLLVHKKQGTNPFTYAAETGKAGKYKAFLRFLGERITFKFYERSKEVRYAFSPANTGIDISTHSLVENADILHLNWINQGFLSLKSLRKIFALSKPIVWTLHDMWAFTGGCHHARDCDHYMNQCGNCPFLKKPGPNDLSHRLWIKKNKLYQDNNITLISPSKWLAEKANKSSLLQNKDIHVIPNAIDTNFFKPRHKMAVRKKLDLPKEKKIIAFISANPANKRKGISYLQAALQHLDEHYASISQDLFLLVIGKRKEELSFRHKTSYTGYIDDQQSMVDYYNAIDLFVLPSLEENLPTTIMEAMACGVPTLAFDTGGIPEMIAHKSSGYIATYESVEDLSEGIHWILEDEEKYSELCKKSRAKATANYSYQVVAKQHLDLYNKLINNSHN